MLTVRFPGTGTGAYPLRRHGSALADRVAGAQTSQSCGHRICQQDGNIAWALLTKGGTFIRKAIAANLATIWQPGEAGAPIPTWAHRSCMGSD